MVNGGILTFGLKWGRFEGKDSVRGLLRVANPGLLSAVFIVRCEL